MVLGFYLVGALSYSLPPGMGCYLLFLTTRHGVLPSIRLALNQLFTLTSPILVLGGKSNSHGILEGQLVSRPGTIQYPLGSIHARACLTSVIGRELGVFNQIQGWLSPVKNQKQNITHTDLSNMRTYMFLSVFRDCRVVRDPQTLKSKGYGFVSFVKKAVSTQSFFLLLFNLLGQFYFEKNWFPCKTTSSWSSVERNKAKFFFMFAVQLLIYAM